MKKSGRFGKYGEIKRLGRAFSKRNALRDEPARKTDPDKRRKKKKP